MPQYIYHVVTPSHFSKFKDQCDYTIESLDIEGFIHCCDENQIPLIIQRYFAGEKELHILKIDTKKLKPTVKVEQAKNGEWFPHIYGKINKDAITEIKNV